MLILIPLVARLTCGARLRDFGLSFDGWWRQAAVGVVATLIAAPPVNAIQITGDENLDTPDAPRSGHDRSRNSRSEWRVLPS